MQMDKKMKSPPHPGALVRDTLAEFGLSIAEAALGLGVTRQRLNNVCSTRSVITPEMAVRLEKVFGGSADMWLKLQMAYDLAAARARTDAASVQRFSPRAA